MKVMIVAPYFYPKIGGMENYAYNIGKGLTEKYGVYDDSNAKYP
jgi:hypothetical protein